MSASKRVTRTRSLEQDDAPELTDAFFERADEYRGSRLVRRGRPQAAVTKERITIRLSPEVLSAFRAGGPGWQSRMNAALQDWLKTHSG